MQDSGKYFTKWYDDNKEDFNARRRERYREDKAYRERLIEQQRVSRIKHPRQSQAKDYSYRVFNGKKRKVYRIGYVAETIDRGEITIRSWERKGILPKPSIESAHRYYTHKQVKLIKELSELITQVRHNAELRKFAIEQKSKELYSLWEQG